MSNVNATMAMARRALLTQQAALSITGENIANVNTPGYARRRGDITPGPTVITPNGTFGSGVMLRDIVSVRDPFIERQLRRTMGDAGRYGEAGRQLEIVEGLVGGLGDTGLSAALDRFWNSWHDLAADPTSRGARSVVRESALGVVNRFQGIHANLAQQENEIDILIGENLERVNLLNRQLADLNRQMLHQVEGGEMDDGRAAILDELAKLMGATYTQQQDGSVTLLLNGVSLVEANQVRELVYAKDESGKPVLKPMTAGGVVPKIETGEIAGLFAVRDNDLQDVRESLDSLARILTVEVNRIHTGGVDQYGETAGAFFKENIEGIADFSLSAAVEMDSALISASVEAGSGDNQIALALAALENEPLFDGETFGAAFRSIVTELGASVRENNLMKDAADLAQEQMENYRESASGVSIDEEMANLIRYENAFNAAAKLTQVLSQMMDTLLTIQ